jgi:hypothetical protein
VNVLANHNDRQKNELQKFLTEPLGDGSGMNIAVGETVNGNTSKKVSARHCANTVSGFFSYFLVEPGYPVLQCQPLSSSW